MSNTEEQNLPQTDDHADNSGAENSDATAEQESSPMSEIEQLQAENAELKDRVLRTQAELENFRRRSQKESLDAMKYQSLSAIRALLPGIDNLQRAISATEQSGDTQNLVDGIKMVAQQFQDALKAQSCETIDPKGEPFDPNLHEALSQIPSGDHDPMTVLEVIECGYRLHDRVIRPAKVMVSCAVPESAPATEESDPS